jgi:hypothetical protein
VISHDRVFGASSVCKPERTLSMQLAFATILFLFETEDNDLNTLSERDKILERISYVIAIERELFTFHQ